MAGVTGDGTIETQAGGPAARSTTTAHWRRAALVAAGGFAFGVLDLLGQGTLKGSWNYAANSISVWLAVAFIAGALMPSRRWSAVAGMGVLLAALAGYYVAAPLAGNTSPLNGIALFWLVTALIGGPLFGHLGQWWRDGSFWQRVAAAALLGGVFVAEGARLSRIVPPEYASAGWGGIVIGLLIPLLIGRTNRERLVGFLAMPLGALIGLVGVKIIDGVNTILF